MTLVLADLIASPKTFSPTGPRTGDNRLIHQQLAGIIRENGDFEYPSGFEAVNEVQNIAIHVATVSGGTYTLTFTLRDGTTFTTGNIAFDANAATIITAIDAASPASVTNGHIVATGGPLSTTPLVLTFSGATVAGQNHGQTTIDGTLLTGGGTAGAATTSTNGQTVRKAWAALKVLGLVTSAPPDQGVDPTGVVTSPEGAIPHGLAKTTVKALITEAAIEDLNAGVETALLAAFGW